MYPGPMDMSTDSVHMLISYLRMVLYMMDVSPLKFGNFLFRNDCGVKCNLAVGNWAIIRTNLLIVTGKIGIC